MGQPIELAVQLAQILMVGDRLHDPASAEQLAESSCEVDERVVQCGEMGWRQPLWLVIEQQQVRQADRLPIIGTPVEPDLVLVLVNGRPHSRRHRTTRLLPESATARRSPRSEMP